MKTLSEKNLAKNIRSLYQYTGGEHFSGETATTTTGTTSGGTDTTNSLITTLTTTHFFGKEAKQQ